MKYVVEMCSGVRIKIGSGLAKVEGGIHRHTYSKVIS
jgi:hypothetical protein